MTWQTMYPATPGSPYTTLASGIDDDDTSISLTTDPGFAAATNLACIWDDTGNFEVVRYTDLTGTTLTVERAFEGSARAWSAGAYIANLIPAYAINSLQNNVNELNSGKIAAAGVTYENLNTNGDVGSTSGTVCAGDDSRLSDSRTPTSHGNEAHSSTFLTEIDIHGATPETAIADDDEILIYDASASANRRMTRANFLDGISASYTLPTASADTLGGVKIGSGITITDGVISATGGSELTFASGETEVTLPGTPSNGQIYEYVGTGDIWTITANTGQTIRLLGDTGNTLTAEHAYACVGLVFLDNVWIVRTQVGTLDLSTV